MTTLAQANTMAHELRKIGRYALAQQIWDAKIAQRHAEHRPDLYPGGRRAVRLQLEKVSVEAQEVLLTAGVNLSSFRSFRLASQLTSEGTK
jgi:hypothetical protein